MFSKHSIHIVFTGILMICMHNIRAQFTLSGSASALGDSCYQITPDMAGQVGSIWSTNKVSLLNSFEIYTFINFGQKDASGADGMTFSLQAINNTVGSTGKGMGMEGILPSFFVEFDTYQNSELGDPAYDHLALLKNGVVDHASGNNLAGPSSILLSSNNAEDGVDHLLHFTWNASTQTFRVYTDCTLRATYTGNIVNTIFNGNPNVYWGFTGSTGALSNDQNFCFLYIYFENTDEKEICREDSVQLFTYPGTYFHWQPSTGLSDTTIQNPMASPDTTTLYHVQYTDLCGNTGYDTILVKVRTPVTQTDSIFICQGDSIPVGNSYIKNTGTYTNDTVQALDGCDSLVSQTYIEVIELPETGGYDTAFCPPDDLVLALYYDTSATYLWNTGDSGPAISVTDTGFYFVDVTKNGCMQRSYFHVTKGDSCYTETQDTFRFYIPDAFTPNNDGINDLFVCGGSGITKLSGSIANRWGEILFRWTESNMFEGWDGTYKGEKVPTGYYVYKFLVEDKRGKFHNYRGQFSLIR